MRFMAVGGREMTQKILPGLGFKTFGHLRSFARPLRPLRRLSGTEIQLEALRTICRGSLVWTWQAPSTRAPGWVARRVMPADLASTSIPWPKPGRSILSFERNADAPVGYYLRCPAVPMEFYVAEKQGLALGYFLLAFAPAQGLREGSHCGLLGGLRRSG